MASTIDARGPGTLSDVIRGRCRPNIRDRSAICVVNRVRRRERKISSSCRLTQLDFSTL